MKTIVAVIRNTDYPATQTTFGAALSKATGVPLFDFGQYVTPQIARKGGPREQRGWDNLFNEISKHDKVIIENFTVTGTEKIYAPFDQKIVILSDGEHNMQLAQRLNEIITFYYEDGTPIQHTNDPDIGDFSSLVKYRAEKLKMIDPTIILNTWEMKTNNLVQKVGLYLTLR